MAMLDTTMSDLAVEVADEATITGLVFTLTSVGRSHRHKGDET